jgi:serine/threonine-protein kinase
MTHLIWNGDTKKVRAIIQQASMIAGTEGDQEIFLIRVLTEVFDGNYEKALAVISSGPRKPYDDQFQFSPQALFFAEVYGLMKQRALERASYDSARIELERRVRERPDDARFHSALGIAYAGLGRKQDAIREGKLGVELLPISKEAYRGTYRVRDLARIYTMVGEHSAALDQLEILLTKPSDVSAALLRIDPTWAPLRGNPRFQKLIATRE